MEKKTLYQAAAKLFVDQNIGMYYCGKRIRTENHVYGPEIRNHYLLVLVNEGKAEMYRDGKSIRTLKKHDLLVMCPGETIYYRAKTPWSIQWIGVYGEAIEDLIKKLGISGEEPVMEISAYFEAEDIMEKIYRSTQEKQIGTNWQQLSLVYAFFALLCRERGVDETADYVSAAKKMIDYNLNNELSVADIAEDLHLNPSYFTRLFVKEVGITPKQYILEKKMRRAKELLTDTEAPIKEIANSVGFSDSLYFSRLFCKKEKMSPTVYRAIQKCEKM